MATTKKKPAIEIETFTCLCCGATYHAQKNNFYKTSPASKMWAYNNDYVPICKNCIDDLYTKLSTRYDEQTAMKIICHYLDMPYYGRALYSVLEGVNRFTPGMYSRIANSVQYKNKTFASSILDGEFGKTETEITVERDMKWSAQDKQNKNFCIRTVGYDPFDEEMTDADRKYCFNILAGYLDTDGITEDGHKLQSVIQITVMHLQCKKLDDEINNEMLKQPSNEVRIQKLTASKTSILSSISKLAQDNNISSANNKNVRVGVGTMSDKIKEMMENNYAGIKESMFDIKTSDAFKQIDQISNDNIARQLDLGESEYTDIIKNQREIITNNNERIDWLVEENRKLKNQVIELSDKKKKG